MGSACFLFMGDGPSPIGLVGAWAPPNGGGPCSSSGLCFLFMGDGPPPIGGGMSPHQMVEAHSAQVGFASCSRVMGPHQLVGALDFTSCVAWTTKWSKFQPITTSMFSFSENVLKLSSAMQNSKNFPGVIYPGPQFFFKGNGGEWKACFCSPIIYWNSYSNEEFTHFHGVRNTPGPSF